jgi:hypothetical protein
MTKTIILTNLKLISLILDYENLRVIDNYQLIDANSQAWVKGSAIFWANIPDPGEDGNGHPLPVPENWFQLPAGYFPTLNSLRSDADTALRNKFLV